MPRPEARHRLVGVGVHHREPRQEQVARHGPERGLDSGRVDPAGGTQGVVDEPVPGGIGDLAREPRRDDAAVQGLVGVCTRPEVGDGGESGKQADEPEHSFRVHPVRRRPP